MRDEYPDSRPIFINLEPQFEGRPHGWARQPDGTTPKIPTEADLQKAFAVLAALEYRVAAAIEADDGVEDTESPPAFLN